MSFPEQVSKEHVIRDCVITLEQISYQVAELTRIREELEARLAALFEHGDNGQKTYFFGKWKITCKSGYILNLNIEEYEILKARLPVQFDPVSKYIKYKVDAKRYKEALKYAGPAELSLLGSLIKEKPSKLHVKITAGV